MRARVKFLFFEQASTAPYPLVISSLVNIWCAYSDDIEVGTEQTSGRNFCASLQRTRLRWLRQD